MVQGHFVLAPDLVLGVVAIATSSSRTSSNSLVPLAIFSPERRHFSDACSGLIRMGRLVSLMRVPLSFGGPRGLLTGMGPALSGAASSELPHQPLRGRRGARALTLERADSRRNSVTVLWTSSSSARVG